MVLVWVWVSAKLELASVELEEVNFINSLTFLLQSYVCTCFLLLFLLQGRWYVQWFLRKRPCIKYSQFYVLFRVCAIFTDSFSLLFQSLRPQRFEEGPTLSWVINVFQFLLSRSMIGPVLAGVLYDQFGYEWSTSVSAVFIIRGIWSTLRDLIL